MQQGTEKYLEKLNAQELILQKQLSKINPGEADRIFNGSQQVYDKIQNDLKNNSENILRPMGKYVPGIDSAITSLKFLQQSGNQFWKAWNQCGTGKNSYVESTGTGRPIQKD